MWERLNPEHELHVVEGEEARAILEAAGVKPEGLPFATRADLVRTDLLARKGGMWVDATVVPFRPLDDWLSGKLDRAGFFAFRDPGTDRLLSSWLLWSEPGNPLTVAWRDALFAYSRERRFVLRRGWRTYKVCKKPGDFLAWWAALRAPDPLWHVDRDRGWANPAAPYYAVHYLFAETIRRDRELARIWETVPARAAFLPNLLYFHHKMLGDGPRWKALIDDLIDHAPVQKLSYKRGDFRPVLDKAEALSTRDRSVPAR